MQGLKIEKFHLSMLSYTALRVLLLRFHFLANLDPATDQICLFFSFCCSFELFFMNPRTVDTNLMCCHVTKQDADCDFAYVDSFASCETLFRNRAPRECLWVIGIVAVGV